MLNAILSISKDIEMLVVMCFIIIIIIVIIIKGTFDDKEDHYNTTIKYQNKISK